MGVRGASALTSLPRLRSYDRAWLDAATPDLVKGLRGGVATLVPFYLAIWLNRHEFAWMALGGWLGTLVDPGGLRSTRAKTTSAFALFGGLALGVSESLARSTWLAALGLMLIAFPASLLRSLGAVWASAGTMITIVVAIGSAQGGSAPVSDGACFTLGAGFATLLSSVIWPIWTHLPLRRAEANVFDALSNYAFEIETCLRDNLPDGDPRWNQLARIHHRRIREAIEEARRLAIGGRARRAGETRIGSNLRVLLGLAEAQFPLLVTLKEASEAEATDSARQGISVRLQRFAERNHDTATTLRTPNLRAGDSTPTVPPPGSAADKSSSIAALLEHLDDASRAAELLTSALDARANAESEAPSHKQKTLGERLRSWRGELAVLRDACSPHSTFFHHGLRVACTVGIASLIGHRVSVHPHWVTVTTLAVLQPYSGATAAKAAQRVLGTVLGSIAAVAITLLLHSPVALAAAMFPLSVAAVATHRRNYRLFTFFLTPVFVLLAERFQGDWWVAVARASDAAIGGGIAFVAAVFVFPSRERTRLPELLARMLDAVANYAVAVFEGAANRHSEASEARIMSARRAAGIALGEAENSLERLLTEPRHDDSLTGEYALQLITYARRSAGALTTIDTYSARVLTREAPITAELARPLTTFMVKSLHQAASFARGEPPEPDAPVPELPSDLDPRIYSTLARLLRGARLLTDLARGGIERVATEPH
ncbi:MAG TPA: FUSC family protein [Polyangiaceae bacterium]|nr:FUSC family protein [Polyangiaceae bacterium]